MYKERKERKVEEKDGKIVGKLKDRSELLCCVVLCVRWGKKTKCYSIEDDIYLTEFLFSSPSSFPLLLSRLFLFISLYLLVLFPSFIYFFVFFFLFFFFFGILINKVIKLYVGTWYGFNSLWYIIINKTHFILIFLFFIFNVDVFIIEMSRSSPNCCSIKQNFSQATEIRCSAFLFFHVFHIVFVHYKTHTYTHRCCCVCTYFYNSTKLDNNFSFFIFFSNTHTRPFFFILFLRHVLFSGGRLCVIVCIVNG